MVDSANESHETRSICPACNAMYDRSVFVCERCGTGLLEIPDAPLLSGSTLDMRYDIEGVVGTGGMGTVYKARQRGMEREVAVKVLHPRFAHEPRAVKRFFREAQAASRLIHPHVVSVFDFGRAVEGHLYMVMELLEGATLGDLIHYRAPLPASLALAILGQICDALEEAHRQRVVHRDLKPDNVLLTSHEDGLWAKVLDFGIARVFREPGDGPGLDRHHSTVEIAGTPAYMSPEQILGKEPDPRSDLYSLGIMLFEMLTRQRPFDDENSVALCMKQLNEEAPRVSTFQSVSEPVERLVKSLLAKRPEDRPQRAREVKALIAGCPESAFPYSVPSLSPSQGPRLGDGATRNDNVFVPEQNTMNVGALPIVLERAPVGLAPENPTMATPFAGPPPERLRVERPGTSSTSPASGSAGAVVREAELKSGAPSVRRDRTSFGRSATEVGMASNERRAKKSVAALCCILAEHQGALATGELANWLVAREREGAEVQREDRRAIERVHNERGAGANEKGDKSGPLERLGELLLALQERALAQNIGLRVGLAEVTDEAAAAPMSLDLARRLAAATTHGQVAVLSSTAHRLGMAIRPQTTVFMPDGAALESAVLRRTVEVADEDGTNLLWGRGLQLRRLGQIGDEALRVGPTMALVQGARGMGKSALVAAFSQGRHAVSVRVSPLANNLPGHTVARLVAAAHGIVLRGHASDLDGLAQLELSDRERELMELLLLDRQAIEAPSVKALARLVVDGLARRSGEGALVIVLEDVHFLDRVSREVLLQVTRLAEKRPWCFVATTRVLKPDTLLADANRIDLRPLGLRAMNQLAEELKIPPRQRHAVIAASQGNPATLRLVSRLLSAQGANQDVPPQIHQLGEGLLPWLLTGLLRAAPPASADRAWCEAAMGEGEGVEDALVCAARLYLERDLPTGLANWVADRLKREGPVCEALGRALHESVSPMDEAERRARRTERLGLYKLAALELEATLSVPSGTRAQRALDVAHLRAQAGDLAGAVSSFEASARLDGERRPTALLRFARTLIDLGENERAVDALELAEAAIIARRDPRALGEWLVLRAKAFLARGDVSNSATALQRARDIATDLGRNDARGARHLAALIQEARAELALATGDREAARTNLRQARDAFRDLGQTLDALRCLIALGETELAMRDYRRAADTFRAASRLAAKAGLVREEIAAEIGLGEVELALGETDEGCQRLRGAFKRVTVEEEESSLGARASLGMAHAMRARRLFADVFRYTERARQLTRSPALIARVALLECESHMGQDQVRRAQKSLAEAAEAARLSADALLMERVRELRLDLDRLGGHEHAA